MSMLALAGNLWILSSSSAYPNRLPMLPRHPSQHPHPPQRARPLQQVHPPQNLAHSLRKVDRYEQHKEDCCHKRNTSAAGDPSLGGCIGLLYNAPPRATAATAVAQGLLPKVAE